MGGRGGGGAKKFQVYRQKSEKALGGGAAVALSRPPLATLVGFARILPDFLPENGIFEKF